ncbi:hypothetical protein [Streptomyces sp. STCH 565 A]|uniref:hypothetical protein n=1 Tax=Streptomyces sp. STCH 565 A TaxID=2950532 RepID=UPI0020751C59|nr:hypothetical protein [Streptomyces sp. STCH 565 A]MCM8555378.1 hypothetical protein [Streptomyces sp. STCH 565 A]
MTDRHTVDTINSDQLDALYADLDRYEEAVGELNEANTGLARRAAQAEAAIARARAVHHQDGANCMACTEDFGRLYASWPCPTIRAINGDQP